MDKTRNAKKPVVDAEVLTAPVHTVTFEHIADEKGWKVRVKGTDDEHEAIHLFLSIAEAVRDIPPICAMCEGIKQPDGSWMIGSAPKAKVDEKLAALVKQQLQQLSS